MSKVILDWTDEKTAKFQKQVLQFKHNLASTGLFTDEALIALLDRHPSTELDVCTMGATDDPKYPNRFRTGDFRDASSQTILDACKAGKVWVNVRKAMNLHSDYKKVLDEMYGHLSNVSGVKIYNPKGGLLLSSPVARVPYHFDKTETILWHVRGQKRLYIYPLTQEFIPDICHEASLTNYLNEDLPFHDHFEEQATILDMQEGEAASWPLNTPHRVDNQSFCVSVTTEYSTRESGMKNAAMITNAVLRHRMGMSPSYSKDGEITRKVKSVFGRVIKKVGLLPDTSSPDMVTFKLDSSAPNYIMDVEPSVRKF